jgi:hypothetical protein
MKRILPILAFAAAAAAQSPFTIGNLVVARVGDGTATLTTATAPVFLDEYTPAGVLVQSIALPTAPNGNNRQFTFRGGAASEGFLNVSANGLYLLLTGYDTPVGSALALTEQAPASTTNRVVARIDLSGQVDTTTALTDAYSGSATVQGNIRGAVSDDGSRFWLSGTGASGTAGVRYVAAVGDTTSVTLQAGAPTNTRVAGVYDGQLYTTSASTVYLGVCKVGDGLPTTGSQPVTLLQGFPTTGGTAASSAYDFFFADANTLYVADDNAVNSTIGGINKWTFDAATGTWTRQYRLQLGGAGAQTAARGLTGFVQNGVTTLYATCNTSGQTTTTLVSVVDTGPASTVTSLITSPANTAFRGVRRIGKPSTVQRFAAACGTTGIKMNGNAEVGTDVRTTLLGPVGFPFVGYGFTQIGLPVIPGCLCTLGHEFSFLVGTPLPPAAAANTLSIPNDPNLIGLAILAQGLDLFAPGGCTSPLDFTLTDYFRFVIQ